MGVTPLKTAVHFLIDASGSMSAKQDDVIGGFNAYVARLRAERPAGVRYRISALTFNTIVSPLFNDRKLSEVPVLTRANYRPGGNTALLDAVGRSLDELRGGTTQ